MKVNNRYGNVDTNSVVLLRDFEEGYTAAMEQTVCHDCENHFAIMFTCNLCGELIDEVPAEPPSLERRGRLLDVTQRFDLHRSHHNREVFLVWTTLTKKH